MVLGCPKFAAVLLVSDSSVPPGPHWHVSAELTYTGEVVVRARRVLRASATWKPTGRSEQRMVKVAKMEWSSHYDDFRAYGTTEVPFLHHEYKPTITGPWAPTYETDTRGIPFEDTPVWRTELDAIVSNFARREEVVDLSFAFVPCLPGFKGFEDACLDAAIANGWDDAL